MLSYSIRYIAPFYRGGKEVPINIHIQAAKESQVKPNRKVHKEKKSTKANVVIIFCFDAEKARKKINNIPLKSTS